MTPAIMPESTSFSMERPPVPVAWKTRQSYLCSSLRVTNCTQGVVTPNMVRPMAGLCCLPLGFLPVIMPTRALAALASTLSDIRFIPEMSVTEYNMQMSVAPT